MRVAAITDHRVVQVRYIKNTSATHVELSGPKLRERLSLESHKGFKFTELQDLDTQLTLPSSPTNLLEPSAKLTLFTFARQSGRLSNGTVIYIAHMEVSA